MTGQLSEEDTDVKGWPWYSADADTEAWSACKPEPEPEPEPDKPQWRRVAPYVAATVVVSGMGVALLTAADQQYPATTTTVTASAPAQPVNMTSADPPALATAPPPPPAEVSKPPVSPDDQWVVNALEGDDFIITDPSGLVDTVHRACGLLRSGESPRQAARDLAATTHTSPLSVNVIVSESQWLYADGCKAR